MGANGSKLLLKDTSTIEDADAIIFTTGYLYDISFINGDVVYERNDSKRISPLYNGVISAKYPTMAFIATREVVNTYSVTYTQV